MGLRTAGLGSPDRRVNSEAMKDRIGVLFVETGNYGGGSFESLYQTVAHLDRRRFRPLVCYLNKTPYVERMREIGVEVRVIGDLLYNNRIPHLMRQALVGLDWTVGRLCPRLSFLYEWMVHLGPILGLRRMVRRGAVDVIHLNNTLVRHFFCIAGLHDLGVPIVSHLRSFVTKGVNPFKADFANRHVARYVAYSEGVRDWWVEVGVDPAKVEVIPNGIEVIDTEPIDVWVRMGVAPRGGPLVGCVGAIKAERAYDFMLRSFARTLEGEPGAFLIIVGRPMDRGLLERLVALARDLGISNSVRFHGHDPAAGNIIAGLDIMVIPYRVEPFGRVLLEAWLARTPVLATQVGRIDKIITNGKDGLLVAHGDEAGLGRAISTLWRDSSLRRSLAEEGRRTVETRFTIGRCAAALESLYGKVLPGEGASPES